MIIIIVNTPLFGGILKSVNLSHLEDKIIVGGMALDQLPAEKKHRPETGIAVH